MNKNLTKLIAALLCSASISAFATTPPAQIPQTGQTNTVPSDCIPVSPEVVTCITSPTGSDGSLQKGTIGTNFSGRFVAGKQANGTACQNGQETITDQQTGLMWVQNPSSTPADNWGAALTTSAAGTYCGYSDWRLPNRRELLSLINYGQTNQATWLKSQGFGSNVRADYYWSSTTCAPSTGSAWLVSMTSGSVSYGVKTGGYRYVWPVRGGQ